MSGCWDVGIDRKDDVGRPDPAGDNADATPDRPTFMDYIDELGGPIVILLLILIAAFLLL